MFDAKQNERKGIARAIQFRLCPIMLSYWDALCRVYFPSCPNRHDLSHRRWRQGWRQCLSEKDSRPDSSDHDTRSEGAKIIKNSTGLCPKTVVREPVLFSQKLIKKFGNCREKSKTPHLSMRSLVAQSGAKTNT